MTEFLMTLAGVAIALVTLMPLLKTGGQTIAAFMRRHQIVRFLAAITAQLSALFVGTMLAVTVGHGTQGAWMRLLAALLMLGTVYAADWLIHKTLLKDLL